MCIAINPCASDHQKANIYYLQLCIKFLGVFHGLNDGLCEYLTSIAELEQLLIHDIVQDLDPARRSFHRAIDHLHRSLESIESTETQMERIISQLKQKSPENLVIKRDAIFKQFNKKEFLRIAKSEDTLPLNDPIWEEVLASLSSKTYVGTQKHLLSELGKLKQMTRKILAGLKSHQELVDAHSFHEAIGYGKYTLDLQVSSLTLHWLNFMKWMQVVTTLSKSATLQLWQKGIKEKK